MFMNQKAVVQDVLLDDSPGVLYQAPANTRARFTSVTLCNTDSVARAVSIHLVKAGGGPGPENQVVKAYSMAAGESWTCPHLNHVLNAGDSLQAFADAPGVVSVYASVTEMSSAG